MKKLFVMMAVAVFSLSAMAQKSSKVDTLLVTTIPQMSCGGCEYNIKNNIRFVKGVKNIKTSLADQRITIIFDKTKCNAKDIEAAFKKLGYDIKVLKK